MTRPPAPLRDHPTGDLPASVEPILLKCLSKDRDDRYASMDTLSVALRAAAAS